jgi:hypothetical protein
LAPNWAAGVAVADSIKALEEYRSRWANINIDKDQTATHTLGSGQGATVGGVYGVAMEDELQIFTLRSNPRGTQPTRRTVSVDPSFRNFAFHPQADVVVVAGQTGDFMYVHFSVI